MSGLQLEKPQTDVFQVLTFFPQLCANITNHALLLCQSISFYWCSGDILLLSKGIIAQFGPS